MKNNSKASGVVSKCAAVFCGSSNSDIGSAILRIGVGALFVLAGVSKFLSLPMTVFMFAQVGLAGWWVYVVAGVEVLGGLMLLLGFWSRLVAIPLGVIMLVATIIQFRFGGGIMGAMAPLVIFLVQVQFYLSGSSTWALENCVKCGCGGTCPLCKMRSRSGLVCATCSTKKMDLDSLKSKEGMSECGCCPSDCSDCAEKGSCCRGDECGK